MRTEDNESSGSRLVRAINYLGRGKDSKGYRLRDRSKCYRCGLKFNNPRDPRKHSTSSNSYCNTCWESMFI